MFIDIIARIKQVLIVKTKTKDRQLLGRERHISVDLCFATVSL
jgi:hypothetical protein